MHRTSIPKSASCSGTTSSATTRASSSAPRPRNRSAIRKYVYDGAIDYVENGAGRLESRERAAEFALEFQKADRFTVNYTNSFEFLTEPFPIGAHLAGSRVTYSMTPLMFVSALIQFNSGIGAVSTNARFRWEYQPGSELFIVYDEERNTLTPSFPSLDNRAFIVKINRLFRL